MRTAAALAMAILIVTAGAGGATAAAPTTNTSTTNDTTFTSEATDGATLGENNTFEANDSVATVHSFISDSNETKQYITAKGTTVYTNSSGDVVNYNATTGEATVNVSVNHGALADMEHGIGANVSTTWYMVNNTSATDPGESNITVYVEWDNSTTVQNIDDSDVEAEDVVTVTNDSGPYGLTFGPLGTTTTDVETDDRTVNGSNTDVVIALSNQSALDMFDESVSEASSGDKLSKLWSGTRTVATVSDGDKTVAVPVYYESAPDDVEETSTYAVYKDVGGTQSLVINLGDSFDDSDEVSVKAIGSAGASTMFLKYISTSSGTSMINTGAMLGMVPIVAGRRQRGAVAA